MTDLAEARAATCRCPDTPEFPCYRPATQEDLLCDICRTRCKAVMEAMKKFRRETSP